MAPRGTLAARVLLFQLLASVCHGLVETCEELQAAFDLTKTQDVVVEMHPFQEIDCGDMTTMTMDSNSLTVQSSEDISSFYGTSDLHLVRFEVTGGAKLFWETNAKFFGTDGQNVNGGAVFVGEGSTVRFMNDVEMVDFGIKPFVEEGSDYGSYFYNGGCVYTDGYFRVDGVATFNNCDVLDGSGGALYVSGEGSVLFNGGLDVSEIYISGESGTYGAGIYNEGKVNIKGDAKFESLAARAGGGIYNAENAQFRFKNSAKALFVDCTANDSTGNAVYNAGYLKFSGPALFVESSSGFATIYVASEGKTVLSDNSVFWDTYDDSTNAAIYVNTGGELVIPSSVIFIDAATDCDQVEYRDDDSC